jgi:hypothetical protein
LARCVRGYKEGLYPASASAGGAGRLPHQAGQGGQVEPDISLKEDGLAPRLTVDRQALEAPALKGSVATFNRIAGAMVETLPGGYADRDVAYQADRVVSEPLPEVEDASAGAVGSLKGTRVGRVGHSVQADEGRSPVEASLGTEPFVALTVGIEAIGGEGIAEGTNGATFVVVAPDGPQAFVPVGVVGAQVDDPFGAKLVDSAQDEVVAKAGVTGGGLIFLPRSASNPLHK